MGKYIKSLILLLSAGMLTSCANLIGPDRTYIDLMDKDEIRFFEPGKDFPTTAGDSGRVYRNRSEIQGRTPASYGQQKQISRQQRLQIELAELENGLNEWERDHYEQNRRYLRGMSEKIYFLRLPNPDARDEYMQSRGHYVDYKHKRFRDLLSFGREEVTRGMSKDQVLRRWGRPTRVDIAGDQRYENERWVFYDRGNMRYVYFERGRVQGWSIP